MKRSSEGWQGGGPPFSSGAMISVRPVGGGWCVSSPIEESLMFLTGDDAEDHARTLGRCLASLGQTAIVELLDHEGDLAGCVTYPARGGGGAS